MAAQRSGYGVDAIDANREQSVSSDVVRFSGDIYKQNTATLVTDDEALEALKSMSFLESAREAIFP